MRRLLPVFDEAGAGTLQVVLNEQGEVVSRTVMEGAYGEDVFGLEGAAVDRIAMEATRDAGGNLTTMNITIRTTEALAEATVEGGARLAAIGENGAVVRSLATPPTLMDTHTLRWTLTGDEWTALIAGANDDPATPRTLSIAVTSTLRAAAWSDANGILPPPPAATDAYPITSSAEYPVDYREPIAATTTWLASIAPNESRTTVLFEAPALSTLAGSTTPATRLLTASPFQALPFAEPATGLVYARARW